MMNPGDVVKRRNLPRGRAVDRGKVAEAPQQTAEAEVPHAAQAAQAAEGRMVCRRSELNCGGLLGNEKVMRSLQLMCEEVAPCFR